MKTNKTRTNSTQPTLCLAAGGSGGHILPALELAKHWHAQHPEGTIVFFSSNKQLDQKIIAQYPFISSIVTISFDKFVPFKFWLYPKWLVQGISSCITSYKQLTYLNPEKVLSTGGLIAIPVVLAAWLKGIRTELYELNVIPGKAIKFLAPCATKLFITFKKTASLFNVFGKDFSHKCELHPYPLRFTQHDLESSQETLLTTANAMINAQNKTEVASHLVFDKTRKTIFVLGGSQGSVLLNTFIKNFLRENKHLHKQIQCIHQTGSHDATDWKSLYESYSIPAITFRYYQNIKDFYLLADLILCRAGAGTLFELLFFKKQSIVIPLVAKSTDHQVDNAREMAQQYPDLFTVVEQQMAEQNQTMLYRVMIQNLFSPTDTVMHQSEE